MRAFIYSNTARFFIRFALVAVLTLCVASCASDVKEPEQHVFTSDELYLIDSYARVRRAGAHFSAQPGLADSLLAALAEVVDSARIARTVSDLSNTPERWVPLFEEIEKRLRDAARENQLEESRS